MHVLQGNEKVGVSFFGIDPTCQTERRAYIRHLSVHRMELLGPALQATLASVWALDADTVRVDLCHFGEAGQLKASNEVKEILSMKKQGFKWKTLINDPESGKRY